ncbi:MAG TPA: hypothetical protein VGF65_11285 [Mycobacterium sp.]|jgi:hypothetical protein
MSGQQGYRDDYTTNDEHNALEFMIQKYIGKMATNTVVKVVGVTNNGEVSPVGRIDVMPMVHQIDPDGNATPHGTIYSVPYHRHGGGSNGIIMDPKVGDVGILAHASRDITGVLATRDFAVPQSRRHCDWQDAIYVGQTLNLQPTNYIRFHDGGVDIVSPGTIHIQAPTITIQTGNCTMDASGNLTVQGEVTSQVGPVTLGTHHHQGVQPGAGQSGPPVPGT